MSPDYTACSDHVLVVEHVTKRYGSIVALDNVSLRIRPGTIHGLLGPNGAGKTTLIRIIVGLSAPDSGGVTLMAPRGVMDRNLRLAYQPEEPALYEYLTVDEFLTLARQLRAGGGLDDSRLAELVGRFELEAMARRLIKNLSAGMRRKLAIVAALAQDPDLLVLDEPTNHLDTNGVVRLKDELRRLRDSGATVLLSTHILDFAAGLCDQVTLLKAGRIIYDGPVAEILAGGDWTLEERVAALIGI